MTLCAIYTSPDGRTEILVNKLPSGLTARCVGQWRDDTVTRDRTFPAAWDWLDALVEEGWDIEIFTTGNEVVDDEFEKIYDQINDACTIAIATAPDAASAATHARSVDAEYASADAVRYAAFRRNRSALAVPAVQS